MNKGTFSKSLFFAAILIASVGFVGGDILQSETIRLQVKEPLEVLPHNSSFSLFPGETLEFNVTVENHASVSYNASLRFALNETEYQEKHVTFSSYAYVVEPGRNILSAWFSVSSTAPADELELTVTISRDLEPQTENDVGPSLRLFAAGAKWAAGNGTSALYINWYDNYCAHHFSDGSDWGPYWREGQIGQIKNITFNLLEQQGITVTCVGDVPSDLTGYELVIFEAWFAIEPIHTQLVRDYLTNGGNIVIIGGAPCYFATYCKDLWPYVTGGQDLASLQDWFGSASFVNSGGTANLVTDKPLGTSLESQSQIYHIDAYGCYALTSMDDDAQIIARWSNGPVFAFTHEYGKGRVYYQAEMDW
jgi:hypothetical protein